MELSRTSLNIRHYIAKSGATFVNSKISIPENITSVKIDIGLSGNAPQSKVWLDANPNTLIFGFEPLSINLKMLQEGSSKWPIKINPDDIGKKLFVIQVALSSKTFCEPAEMKITDHDSGSSSLLPSTDLKQSTSEFVPVFKLDDFMEFVDFNKIRYVEYLKIDAQGMDLEIILGAKRYLKKVMFLTAEIDQNYLGTTNNIHRLNLLMLFKGFLRIGRNRIYILEKLYGCKISVDDPTYVNIRALKVINKNFFIYQKG